MINLIAWSIVGLVTIIVIIFYSRVKADDLDNLKRFSYYGGFKVLGKTFFFMILLSSAIYFFSKSIELSVTIFVLVISATIVGCIRNALYVYQLKRRENLTRSSEKR
ncbi:MAG: hypothetical protein WAZ60_02650 [Desulfosalsimonadaceae bacterium]